MTTTFRLTPDTLCQIRTLARGGKTATQIAAIIAGGCTPAMVQSICDRHGYDLVREAAVVVADRLVVELGR